ncbi:hypothetical protein ACGFX4_39350 [Kitasatospora sp. NPDC048365]|uniref:hypothetical protein n=1 Tax=Kitasatospora sp. NPDC048365 TaxID=3364050 RepID=UPI003713BEC2
MPARTHQHQRDLVGRIVQAVADDDRLTLEILLIALDAVADESMLARLDAALGRTSCMFGARANGSHAGPES